MDTRGDMFGVGGGPAQMFGPVRPRKTFVLCFDGTGNKFSGTDGDSNILKIFRMLDRNDATQLHYYQPGIGTYVQSTSLSHTSFITRFNSWFQKARDSAIGFSFDEHVMGGYKFLMRYYSAGDDIYFFGFSRGAYVARFLAEMLDYVGLLGTGNEEMARFAWKAFVQWQQRLDGTKEEEEKKKKMFKFLEGFRETFSRPVRRIRFLGLFDTVNSVPRFENAWMQRSKFPYTARSSALVIRHAVGIDERRAKFRQDLIGDTKTTGKHHERHGVRGRPPKRTDHFGVHLGDQPMKNAESENVVEAQRFRRPSQAARLGISSERRRSMSPAAISLEKVSENETASIKSGSSRLSLQPVHDVDDDEADEALPQDIQEIWFPGCHADIGGGWELYPDEEISLSHGPLVWIVREAQKAGLRLDHEKVVRLRCHPKEEEFETDDSVAPDAMPRGLQVPQVNIIRSDSDQRLANAPTANTQTPRTPFQEALHLGATKGRMHDCLKIGEGLSTGTVLWWKMMEYLPFRRMDLQPDSSWKPIRWPLPKGEVRDVPDNAWIHSSAIRRMEANENYRPGNLIIGGGGRGVRVAPKELGMGSWEPLKDQGDPVSECVVRKKIEEVTSEK